MKTIIIGDIHGCYEQFEKILIKSNLSVDEDKLILLGDLIDRGMNSYEVLCKIIQLKEKMGSQLVILRGSHETLLLSSKHKDKLLWRMVGKGASIRSFAQHGEKLSNYSTWIKENTVSYYEEQYFQCTHASVKNKPLNFQDDHTLMINHTLTKKNQYRGKLTITGHIHLKSPMYFDGFGRKHSLSYDIKNKLPDCGVICIDTGCGKKGRPLTGMIVEGVEYRLLFVL